MVNRDLPALVSNFADLWLVRLVPNMLQDEVYYGGQGVFSRLYESLYYRPLVNPRVAVAEQGARAFYSVALARKFIEEEQIRPAKGQYVYAHIYLPHPGYVMNQQCQYSPANADYYSQTLCATRLMISFIRELKRLGRYEESTIIFQSDHTMWDINLGTSWSSMGNQRNAELLRENLWKIRPEELDSLTRSLLLIKPPGRAGVPLEVSQKPAQLVDIPATLYDLVNVTPRIRPPQGISLLASAFPSDREAHLFLGYRQRTKDGRFIFLGQDFNEG
jgi:hypothetical protein